MTCHPEERCHGKNRSGREQGKRRCSRAPGIAAEFRWVDAEFLADQSVQGATLVLHDLRGCALGICLGQSLSLQNQGEFVLLGRGCLLQFFGFSCDLGRGELPGIGHREPSSMRPQPSPPAR
jgi:hypothetical protein